MMSGETSDDLKARLEGLAKAFQGMADNIEAGRPHCSVVVTPKFRQYKAIQQLNGMWSVYRITEQGSYLVVECGRDGSLAETVAYTMHRAQEDFCRLNGISYNRDSVPLQTSEG